jgi:hypothetical protein
MQQRYDLIARDTYPFPCFDQRGRNLLCLDQVDVFKFVPKAGSAQAAELSTRDEAGEQTAKHEVRSADDHAASSRL